MVRVSVLAVGRIIGIVIVVADFVAAAIVVW